MKSILLVQQDSKYILARTVRCDVATGLGVGGGDNVDVSIGTTRTAGMIAVPVSWYTKGTPKELCNNT